MKNGINLRNNTACGIFAAITAIFSQIALPLPFSQVPFTLQVFAVVLTAIVLGGKLGFTSQIVYILLGAIGIPVFAGFHGGIQVILGPTGGYILSYPIMALIIGYFGGRYKNNYVIVGIGGALGLAVCYAIGCAQLSILGNLSFKVALSAGVLPFIPFDIIKVILGITIGILVRNRMPAKY